MPVSIPTLPVFAPRPIRDRAWWDMVAQAPAWTEWRQRVFAWADEAPAKPARLEASDYLHLRRANDRGRHDDFTHNARRHLSALAVRRCLLGDGDDDLLLDTLWAQFTEPTWCHAAHLGSDLPQLGKPVLDLMACEQAALFAELIELLGPWLERQSPTVIPSLVDQIDRLVLGPFGDGAPQRWDRDEPGINNWTGVCGGSLLAACLSFAAQGRPRPAAQARALESVRRYIVHAFTPDGECDEGIGYWNYGMLFAVLGLSRLDPAQWPARDRLRRVADYPRRCHLFDDTFISGNDSGMTATAPLSIIPCLAGGLQDDWLWRWAWSRPQTGIRHLGLMLREMEAIALKPAQPLSRPQPAPAIYLQDQQIGVLRAGPLLVALSGGNNEEAHNHNDLGQIVVALNERLVLPDLGAPKPYPADFFHRDRRYGYLVASSRGHSVPVIGGCEQSTGPEAAARLLSWQPEGSQAHLELDLTAAYPPAAGLSRWTRRLERDGDGFAIIDRFRCARPTVIGHVLWSVSPFAGNGLAITVEPAASPIDDSIAPAAHNLAHRFAEPLHRRTWTFTCLDELVVRTRLQVA